MYEFMDTYGGLSREDIMPNVIEAYETGDKLYFMSDTFYVQSVFRAEWRFISARIHKF
jgi:hypothetical protein